MVFISPHLGIVLVGFERDREAALSYTHLPTRGDFLMNKERLLERLLQAIVLVLAGLWIYSPTYHGKWLWDDDSLVTKNPEVLSGSLEGLFAIWMNPSGFDYFPLTYSALWMQALFFGTQPTGYHIVTILLHLTSGLLLWWLLARINVPGAWVASLIFTIHPVCVESVAWISETKNTLSLVFFLGSCIFWVKQDDETPGRRRERLYLASLVLFLLAMLAKTSVVAMPLLTLLYAWWKRNTVTSQDIIRASPMFLISLVLGIITIQYQWGRAVGSETFPIGGIGSRLAIAGMAMMFYLATTIWPIRLLPIYPRWDVDPPKAWQFLPWLLVGAGIFWLWKHRDTTWGRAAILAFGFFLLMISPVLGFVDFSFMRLTWVADHFLYLPMIGPIALLVAAATTWIETRDDQTRAVFTALVAGIMLFLGLNSFFYANKWIDEEHLWEHTLAINPDAWQAHSRVGVQKLNRNDIEGAYYHFTEAARLRPDVGETMNNLALILARKGRPDEAIAAYERAVAISPVPAIRANLADLCLELGHYAEARFHYEELLKAMPDNPFVLHKHALALFNLGEKDMAIREFRRVLEIAPSHKEAAESLKVAVAKRAAETASETKEKPSEAIE
jgi:protein O-mannosyl-transferase